MSSAPLRLTRFGPKPEWTAARRRVELPLRYPRGHFRKATRELNYLGRQDIYRWWLEPTDLVLEPQPMVGWDWSTGLGTNCDKPTYGALVSSVAQLRK